MRCLLFIVVLLAATGAAADDTLVVRAGLLHTLDGAPIDDAVVVVRDGRIARVGRAGRVREPAGARVVEAAVVTPGFVDAYATVGLSGAFGQRGRQVRDQDQLELSDPVQPELRPEDAWNGADPLVAWVRRYGVTTLHTGHGPGAVLSGQTMLVKTAPGHLDDVLLRSGVAVAATLGPQIARDFEHPGTRARTVADLREALLAARAHGDKRDGDSPPAPDLAAEALLPVLDGERLLLVTANTVTDITAALRLQREFGVRLAIAGGAEAWQLTDALRAAEVPVFLHPPMVRAAGARRNLRLDSGVLLGEAGVPWAYQSGFEAYVPKSRVLLFEAQVAYANGLDEGAALAAISAAPADLLGIGDRVGRIRRGLDADLVLFDGPPLEYLSRVCAVVVDGVVTDEGCY